MFACVQGLAQQPGALALLAPWPLVLIGLHDGATLGVAYVDTNAKAQMYRYGPVGLSTTPQATTENKDPGKGTLVLSVQKTF